MVGPGVRSNDVGFRIRQHCDPWHDSMDTASAADIVDSFICSIRSGY